VEFLTFDESGDIKGDFLLIVKDFLTDYALYFPGREFRSGEISSLLSTPKFIRGIVCTEESSQFKSFNIRNHRCYSYVEYDADHDAYDTMIVYPQGEAICFFSFGGTKDNHPLYPVFEAVIHSIEFSK
ncbi:MAG: hypothetical protein IJS53_00215, partial [Clostridia bacterium]|nr:hypothetical protein [Clostridia bacterium]